MEKRIYLDYNATTPIRPEAADLMGGIMCAPFNASTVHGYGREGRSYIEKARRQVASIIQADQNNVIFNSGATEGNNTVLKHFAGQKIAVSAIEHPSVLEACPAAIKIPATENGLIDLLRLEEICKEHKPALVSCMMVNNETGIIQPIAEASEISKRYGAYFHCDGVQAYGRIPFTLLETGVDFLTVSSHKCGGPQGVGALILGLCGETPTLLHGGGQEKKARAGTENVAGIAGFGMAADLARASMSENHKKMKDLQIKLERGLKGISKSLVIIGEKQNRAPNTTLFCLPGALSETLLMALDLEGIAASNGSACSSGSVKASHVLHAMNIDPELAKSAIRFSYGYQTTSDEIDNTLAILNKICQRLA
jgi:cysteine desulfurase